MKKNKMLEISTKRNRKLAQTVSVEEIESVVKN